MKLKIGDKAPDFTLLDQNEKSHKLSDYQGQWVLLYFYPKDNTPGCSLEAFSVRDNYSAFTQFNAVVLGVSKDSSASHKEFDDKYGLGFTLLADEDKKLNKMYGVWGKKKMFGKEFEGTLRTSFLIDPNGKIAKIYEKVKPAKHGLEVLGDLRAMQK